MLVVLFFFVSWLLGLARGKAKLCQGSWRRSSMATGQRPLGGSHGARSTRRRLQLSGGTGFGPVFGWHRAAEHGRLPRRELPKALLGIHPFKQRGSHGKAQGLLSVSFVDLMLGIYCGS